LDGLAARFAGGHRGEDVDRLFGEPLDRVREGDIDDAVEEAGPGLGREIEPNDVEGLRQAGVVLAKATQDAGLSAALVWNPETLLRLRNAVGRKVGLNLDPSHLMWMGADPIASARALGSAIHHCHGKDTRIERGLADVNGLLELKDLNDVASRTWNYVAVGAGHDLQWWTEFFSVVRMVGYNGWVGLEMEDFTMSTDGGIRTSVDALQATISR
jgi:sugar phosphate isomerase/epimerase